MAESKPKEVQNKDKDPYKMCQEACKTVFDPKRLKDLYENELKVEPKKVKYDTDGEGYDITGFSALQVIAVMSAIINDSDKWIRDQIFYFFIKKKNNEKEQKNNEKEKKNNEEKKKNNEKDSADKIFKLKARPTPNQPGNGFVSVVDYIDKKGYIDNGGKTHQAMNEALVKTLPGTLADVILKLFKDNSEIRQEGPEYAEEYFLLLFEIARRLSNKEDKTNEGKLLDGLPIGSAIARKLKTLSAKSLQEDLNSLTLCFKELWLYRENNIKEVIKNCAAETLRSCVKELEDTFCGHSVADLKFKLDLREGKIYTYTVREDLKF